VRSWRTLIEVPFVAGPRTAAPELIRIRLAKFAAPFTNGFISYDHSPLTLQLFNIVEAEAEPEIQPHGVAEVLWGKRWFL
jgi:hypothetical protein